MQIQTVGFYTPMEPHFFILNALSCLGTLSTELKISTVMLCEQYKVLFNRHFIMDQTDTSLVWLYARVWLVEFFVCLFPPFKLQVVLFD